MFSILFFLLNVMTIGTYCENSPYSFLPSARCHHAGKDEPVKMKNLTYKRRDGWLEIEWNRLDENVNSCVTGFYVTWQNNNKVDSQQYKCVQSSETFIKIPILQCVKYTIEVYPYIQGKGPGIKSRLKDFVLHSKHEVFDLRNVTLERRKELLEIRWMPFDENISSCVTRYCVTWQNEDKTEPRRDNCVEPPATSIQIPNTALCVNYSLEVHAEIERKRFGNKSLLSYLAYPNDNQFEMRNVTYKKTNELLEIRWNRFDENINSCVSRVCVTWQNENKTEPRRDMCVQPSKTSIQIPITLSDNYNIEVYAEIESMANGTKFHLYYLAPPVVGTIQIYLLYFTIVLLISLTISILSYLLYYKTKKRKINYRNQDVPKSEENILLPKVSGTSIDVEHLITLPRKEFYSNLTSQFQSLSESQYLIPHSVGSLPENSNKNRNANRYLPYDFNRIILSEMPGMGDDDYINASYINGYDRPNAYIAAQGPKFFTVKDFWRMIWQEVVPVIVMATGVMEDERMCAEYWPQRLDTFFECGPMMINLVKEHIYEHYTYRQLEISYDEDIRNVEQFHLNWEKGVFEPDKVLPVVIQLRKCYKKNCGPILIHSGHGVGRTGTLILCDMALQMAEREQEIDFYNLTARLRNQRISMVKDLEHYILGHFIVNEFFLEKTSPFPKALPLSTDTNIIIKQLAYLETLSHHDGRLKELVSKTASSWNTVFPTTLVNRYGNRHFILSQTPTQDQLSGFWKVVAEKEIRHMMLLNKEFKVRPYRHEGPQEGLVIRILKTTVTTYWKVVNINFVIFELDSKKKIHERKLSIFGFDHWKSQKLTPNLVDETIKMIDSFNSLTKDDKMVLVSCWDGTTGCGLFTVLSYTMEKYVLDSEIDVCNAVRIARKSGRTFVADPKQLKFVYKFLEEFIQNNDDYQII